MPKASPPTRPTPSEVARYFQDLLGFEAPWQVADLVTDHTAHSIEIRLEHVPASRFACPHCQALCPVHDHAPTRRWRHLDAMLYQTFLTTATPRVRCGQHGVGTVAVPWAGFSARWTLDLERHAIAALVACSTITAASKLLGISWHTLQNIMQAAVERGVARRVLDGIELLGLDEKSYLRGQSYISVCNDLVGGRVLEVSLGRTSEEAAKALEVIPLDQRESVAAVAIDMSAACAGAVKLVFPRATVVIDRFHVSQLANKMVHEVRKGEHARLLEQGDDTLTGTSRMWLWSPGNMPPALLTRFETVAELNLLTAQAWQAKENLAGFWEQPDTAAAANYFEKWTKAAEASKIPQVIKLAKTLGRYLPGLLAYHLFKITNALSEGMNSKIQALKSAARGFRNYAHYRIRILFYCGRLELNPI